MMMPDYIMAVLHRSSKENSGQNNTMDHGVAQVGEYFNLRRETIDVIAY
jgi:hypothetical protein